jgi:hypothetical protein
MMDIDYKKVVFTLIERGFCTHQDVRLIVGELAVVESLDASQNSPLWKEAERLCALLNQRVIANGFKPFAVNKTSVGALEKMLRIDNRDPKETESLIMWCTQDDFWYQNIRSPEKLRKHYDLMSAQRAKRGPRVAPTVTPRDDSWEKELKRRSEESVSVPRGFLKGALKGVQ